jgi:aldehyde:ferredoxin oxidoreductase
VPEFGYSGEILNIDLSTGSINKIPTTPYAERFLGGRGIGAKIYWDMVPPETRAFDPDNCLIFATGPVTGFTRVAGGCRWQVCGKSAVMEPEAFSYANLGEKWGIWLKCAGYDGLVVRGKADKPAYIVINNDSVTIKDASSLWGKSAFVTGDSLKAELGKEYSVLTIGPAAENLVSFTTMMTDDGASGAGGLGSVMGSKNLKAIVVAGNKRPEAADPERLNQLAAHIVEIRRETWKNWLGSIPGRTRLRSCYGCVSGCFRKSYEHENRRYKYFCQATDVYAMAAMRYPDNATEVALLAARLCDHYGLDTTVMQPLISWLADCYREGVISEKETGLPLEKIGSAEFIETLTRKLALREGFGDILSQGAMKAAAKIGGRARELLSDAIISKANETRDYDPRLIPTNGLLYATEPRRPINQLHETAHSLWLWRNWATKHPDGFLSFTDLQNVARGFWDGAVAVDYTTYEGKALAAKKIQDRTYAKESLLLCDFLWPIIWIRFADDHTGDPTMESRLLTAITGQEIDESGLNKIGERIFNLQRAVLLRQGWGGRNGDTLLDHLHDEPLEMVFFNPECIVPDKDGKPVSRKGNKINRDDFEKLKDEYYELRGWDIPSGLPTKEKFVELGLEDIATGLKAGGLLR